MSQPFVTVIVPARNEERYIERCLYSLAAQDYPRERLEVLVLDGMSTDETPRIVTRFAAESTLDVRLLDNPRRKPAGAMNIALGHARGEIVVRLDAHATAATDFISRSVAALEAGEAECVGGVIESEGDTWFGRAVALAMASRFGVGGAAFRTGGEPGATDTVAFGAYRASVFETIGGFAEDIDRGEDDEFNYRLLDTGGMILLDPRIRATYTVRGDMLALWRQYFAYGRAKPEVLRRHPAQARVRQVVPPSFVAALATTALAGRRTRWRPLLKLAGAYGAAVAGASMLTGRKQPATLPALPVAFACLHVAYGLGFFVGAGDVLRHALVQTAENARRTEIPT
ncbi:MAG TPA: glycosyltransferase family 2 protein [Dehalococcoidia bacterium]|nr:glycosyltransferase family 2 protein [Dehalococcoidia bacterium]